MDVSGPQIYGLEIYLYICIYHKSYHDMKRKARGKSMKLDLPTDRTQKRRKSQILPLALVLTLMLYELV